MRFKCLALALVALALPLAVNVSGASAASEFGDSCTANEAIESEVTLFELSNPGSSMPTAAPAGVLTAWKVNLIPTPISVPQTVSVLRPNPATHVAQVIASTSTTVTGGLTVIPARVPVQAGDRVALSGPEPFGTLICEETAIKTLGGFEGTAGVGASPNYIELSAPVGIPVVGVVEPDADNDGFGDETQDKCPQSALLQTVCPVVVVDSYPVAAKNKVIVIVGTSNAAPVTVSGTVKLPKPKKKKKGKRASASATATLKPVTSTVTPGALGKFTLSYPGKLKKALKELPKGKKLTLNITATATSVTGQVSADNSSLKLKH